MILVTGGSGFIGSNFIHHALQQKLGPILNLDKLTYAGNPDNLSGVDQSPDYSFVRGDIIDRPLLRKLLQQYRPRAIVHFAAESHVDRSISGPDAFINTNVTGTFHLLSEALEYWKLLPEKEKREFRFLHVSTDEVFGSLSLDAAPFNENSNYAPSSPYSASKAAADHLVRAYHHTYGLPTIISNCTNNYGPRQHPEKLIPITIINALAGKALPLYGQGINERNWLYVDDHCRALALMLEKGIPGETYLVGDRGSRNNREVIETICSIIDELHPESPYCPHISLLTHVSDRPGHDLRYDIDASKLERSLGWKPLVPFQDGIQSTIEWYLSNPEWIERTTSGEYQKWIRQHYATEKPHA